MRRSGRRGTLSFSQCLCLRSSQPTPQGGRLNRRNPLPNKSSDSTNEQQEPRLVVEVPPAEPEGPFLGPQRADDKGKKTLVLDLDETLVHSSYQPLRGTSFVVEIELGSVHRKVYVSKRPGVDNFLECMASHFEIVLFTASIQKYANPVMDVLDANRNGRWRLFRDACTFRNNNYIKDLSKLGRPLKDVIIVDNNPYSFCLQPDNGLGIESWFDNPEDDELDQLARILEGLAHVYDIPMAMRSLDSDNDLEPISSGDEMLSNTFATGKGG